MKNTLPTTHDNSRIPVAMRELGIVDQIKQGTMKKNRLAMLAGSILGSFVPVATYVTAHCEVQPEQPLYFQLPALMVLGGLVYSAMTVFSWAKVAFKHPAKAVGFVVLTEGTMTFSHSGVDVAGVHLPVLSYAALALLMAINAVAAGSMLVLDQKKARRR